MKKVHTVLYMAEKGIYRGRRARLERVEEAEEVDLRWG